MSISLEGALKIPLGGTGIPELTWLAEVASGCRKIIELGSYHGRSTRAMLDNSQARIWCIDSWAGAARKGVVSDDADYQTFLSNVRDCETRVVPIRMRTSKAYKILTGLFDMVFIDADHNYKSVKFDIVHYAPLLRPGGLLCGHDFLSNRDVTRAVRELIPNVQVALPRKTRRNIWWIRSNVEVVLRTY